MKILKNKRSIITAISIAIFLCVLIGVITLFFNKPIPVSSDIIENTVKTESNEEIIVPNVTKENTTLKISDTKKKVESVNITATKKLDEYNLLYFIDFNNTKVSKIKNTNYSKLNDTILIVDENCTIYFKYELNGNYSEDVYKIKISNIYISEITSEKVSKEELKKEEVNKTEVSQSTSPYYIKVNYGANVVTIYTKDENGKYTVPYKAMLCSCGTYTPKSGTYKTSNKYTWRPLVHNVYGQYATRIVNKILFHSVPYSTNKKDALLYEEYDKLGKTASEGCVRLTVKDAKWIYDNCPRGTMVEFYSSSNPGPLGKPSAQKISSNLECRNWDPTDPASNNPWHSYKEEDTNTTISNNIINNSSNSSVTNNVISNITNSTDINNNIITNETITNNIANNSNNLIENNTTNNVIINNTPSTDIPTNDIPATDDETEDIPPTNIGNTLIVD